MKHKNIEAFIIAVVCIIIIILCVLMATPANAYDGERITTARQEALHEAAEILRAAGYADDSAVLTAIKAEWWAQEEALHIIAKTIQNEADPEWCAWEHSVAVGAVILNRVNSPYFPDTVKEVVAQPGQYLESYTRDFDGITQKSYEAAKAALDGDHDVPPDAYWQDNKVQGAYIWKSFLLDTGWFRSKTYICCGVK